MASQSYDKGNQQGPELPPASYGDPKLCTKDHAAKLRAWQDSRIPYQHPYRMRRHVIWSKADRYSSGVQWLQRQYTEAGTFQWSQIEFRPGDNDKIPTPTLDDYSPPIENEAARLGRPEYEPYVRPSGDDPTLEARTGARLSEQVLRQSLEDMEFVEEEDKGELQMPLYGGWALLSYWDQSWEKTVAVPSLTAMQCPAEGCGFKVASPYIDQQQALQQDPTRMQPEPDPQTGGYRHKVTHCLTCEPEPAFEGAEALEPTPMAGPPELESFTPIEDELQEKDHFGRPMGQDQPLGEWKMKTISPYDVFIDNLGLDVTRRSMREFTVVTVECLDDICNRWDNGYLVKPEAPSELMKYHPIAGERSVYAYGSTGAQAVFGYHARVKQTHKLPWREREKGPDGAPTDKLKMNRGRSLYMAGDVVLFDGDYLIESANNPGVTIDRAHLDYAPYRIRSGGKEMMGTSMSEGIFDAQDLLNEIASQTSDARQTEGSPKWLTTRSMNMDYQSSGDGGAEWVYDPPLDNPSLTPQRQRSELMNSAVYQEVDRLLAYITRHTGMNDAESGNPPPGGVWPALALQIMVEQSSEKRKSRIRRIRLMLERCYKHGLQLIHELAREPRKLWTRDDTNAWRQQTWTGLDLAGQTDVRIDAEPEHSLPTQRMQQLKDMKDMFPDMFANPRAARKLAKRFEFPIEAFEGETAQDEAAQRELSLYLDSGRQPVVDPDLDDHTAHHQQHGEDFMRDRWRDLEDASDWDTALLAMWGWEQMYEQMEMQFGEMWPPALELRILQAWQTILAQRGFQPKPGTEQALEQVLRMRAHDAAHKQLSTMQMAAAAMGAPVPAAPGGSQTPSGTVPTPPPVGASPEGTMPVNK